MKRKNMREIVGSCQWRKAGTQMLIGSYRNMQSIYNLETIVTNM